MSALEQSLELKVEAPSAKPLLRTRAITRDASSEFPTWFIKALDRNAHLKPKLRAISLTGWKAADVHGWRASFVVCCYQAESLDLNTETMIAVPSIGMLKNWVDAFYPKGSV